ncbi:hypothetical protein ACWD7C_18760 [Streptomyces sp. NPDC005134]|uniref:hypothetical protein n=1 Tax=unclassified Streptomyces TaxID=2593676 RepID=UPI0033BCEA70
MTSSVRTPWRMGAAGAAVLLLALGLVALMFVRPTSSSTPPEANRAAVPADTSVDVGLRAAVGLLH